MWLRFKEDACTESASNNSGSLFHLPLLTHYEKIKVKIYGEVHLMEHLIIHHRKKCFEARSTICTVKNSKKCSPGMALFEAFKDSPSISG